MLFCDKIFIYCNLSWHNFEVLHMPTFMYKLRKHKVQKMRAWNHCKKLSFAITNLLVEKIDFLSTKILTLRKI